MWSRWPMPLPARRSVSASSASSSLQACAMRDCSPRWAKSRGSTAPASSVFTASYDALGLEWDPATAGSADDLVPGLSVATVERSLRTAYSRQAAVRDGAFGGLLARVPAPVVVGVQPV